MNTPNPDLLESFKDFEVVGTRGDFTADPVEQDLRGYERIQPAERLSLARAAYLHLDLLTEDQLWGLSLLARQIATSSLVRGANDRKETDEITRAAAAEMTRRNKGSVSAWV